MWNYRGRSHHDHSSIYNNHSTTTTTTTTPAAGRSSSSSTVRPPTRTHYIRTTPTPTPTSLYKPDSDSEPSWKTQRQSQREQYSVTNNTQPAAAAAAAAVSQGQHCTTTKSKSTSIQPHSSKDHHQQQHQPIPTSPNKKLKLYHLPQPDYPLHQAMVHHHPTLDTLKSSKKKPKLKTRANPPWSSHRSIHHHHLPPIRSRPASILSFILQILICYLLLAYFYFCPKDPSQNPFVCRNLAELHWSLEPHLSPYLLQFNHHIRTPIQSRIDRKLRPIYLDYLLPTWNQVSPHLSQLLELIRHYIHRSTLLDRFSHFHSDHLLPILHHIHLRYQQKLAPPLNSFVHHTHQTWSTLQSSKLIRSIRTHYLPRLNRSLLRFIIRPLRETVLPSLHELYLQTIRPILIRSFDSTYQYLIIDENLLKRQLRNIKRSYRIKLLRPLKNLHEVYVRPQITKIVRKLDEYHQSSTRHNESSSSVQFDSIKTPDHSQEPQPLDRLSSQPSPDPVVIDNDHHHAKLEPQAPTADASQPSSPNIQARGSAEPIVGNLKESNQSTTSFDPTSSPQDRDDLGDLRAEMVEEAYLEYDDEMYDDEYLEDQDEVDYLDDDDDLLIDTENLTVDPDEFMDEISHEIASEADAETTEEPEPSVKKQSSRTTPEETAAERQRLEALAVKGFEDMARMEKEVMSEFLRRLREKRHPENLRLHEEFIEREDRLKKIREESSKLIERITHWYQKNVRVESKTMAEKKLESELVIKKSKLKFESKLIEPHLLEIDTYGQREYKLEDAILNEAWTPIYRLASEIQAELGTGLTWLDDVNHYDWSMYHRFRTQSEALKTTMEGILNGVESEYLREIPRPDFFESIGRLRSTIERINEDFQASLDRLHASHLLALSHPSSSSSSSSTPPPLNHHDPPSSSSSNPPSTTQPPPPHPANDAPDHHHAHHQTLKSQDHAHLSSSSLHTEL